MIFIAVEADCGDTSMWDSNKPLQQLALSKDKKGPSHLRHQHVLECE